MKRALLCKVRSIVEDGKNAVLELRSQDNKHRWIVQLDLNSGKITELDRST